MQRCISKNMVARPRFALFLSGIGLQKKIYIQKEHQTDLFFGGAFFDNRIFKKMNV